MWSLVKVDSSYNLWFSDGKPINTTRGRPGVSSRLIVDQQGFLDLTEQDFAGQTILDANGSKLIVFNGNEPSPPLKLSLEILGDGTFILSLITTSQIIGTGMVISILPSPYSNLLECRSYIFIRGVRNTQTIARSIRRRCCLHR